MLAKQKKLFSPALKPLIVFLASKGVKPNHLTLTGLFLGLLGATAFFWNYPVALALVLLAFLIDGIDGQLAREFKTASRFGAYFDAVCDKVVEVAVISAFVIHSGAQNLGIFAPSLSVLISYFKYRGGKSEVHTFFDRAERLTFFFFVAVAYYFLPGTANSLMLFFSLLCLVALAQIFFNRFKELKKESFIEMVKSKF